MSHCFISSILRCHIQHLYSLQVFHQHGAHQILGVSGDASKILIREAEVIAHNVGARLLLTLIQKWGDATQQNIDHNTQTPAIII